MKPNRESRIHETTLLADHKSVSASHLGKVNFKIRDLNKKLDLNFFAVSYSRPTLILLQVHN